MIATSLVPFKLNCLFYFHESIAYFIAHIISIFISRQAKTLMFVYINSKPNPTQPSPALPRLDPTTHTRVGMSRGWDFNCNFKMGMRVHTPPCPGFRTG